MPTIKTLVPNAGDAWRRIVSQFQDQMQGAGEFTMALSLNVEAGRVAIVNSMTLEGEPAEYWYVLNDLADGELYAPTELTTLSGWMASCGQIPYEGPEGFGYDVWSDRLADAKRDLGLSLTGCALAGDTDADYIPADGAATCYVRVFTAASTKGCYVDFTSVSVLPEVEGLGLTVEGAIDGPTLSVQPQITVAGELEDSLARIAQALEDIAMTRMDFSMNNGAIVVSVVGGTAVT